MRITYSFIISFLCFFVSLSAQSSLTSGTYSTSDLNTMETHNLNIYLSAFDVDSFHLIQMNNTMTMGQPNVQFTNPFTNETTFLYSKQVSAGSEMNYDVWYGESYYNKHPDEYDINSGEVKTGYLILLIENGLFYGILENDGDTYQIRPLGNNKHVIYLDADVAHGEVMCERNHSNNEIIPPPSPPPTPPTQDCPIRVLSFYTPKALDKFSNDLEKLKSEIKLSIESANVTLANSPISQNISYELLGVFVPEENYGLIDEDNSGDWSKPWDQDLKSIKEEIEDLTSSLSDLRHLLEADVLLFYTGKYKNYGAVGR